MVYPKRSEENSHNTDLCAGEIEASPRFANLEERVLQFWEEDGTFQASLEKNPLTNSWIFNDGPPFANGLPHYGHLLTGYAKDVFPRFQTMRGMHVDRRFGWDTHGLPAELEAMKQLGITEKSEIEEMGIDVFNEKAREAVLRYTREWEAYVTRQARWVDFENGYKTLDISYMESVLWAFKQLYDKGLAYSGQRILPYCWRDQTPLSNHELRMDDDVYQMRQDPSVTVGFTLKGERAEELGLDRVQALAWTTTPWTLPTNQALAVGPEIEYVVVSRRDPDMGACSSQQYLIAKDRLTAYAKPLGYTPEELGEIASAARSFTGAQLEGIRYEPLWDYFTDTEKWGTASSWQILVADYVSTGDGTGIVHQAPAYGEDDQLICQQYGIPVIVSVNEAAEFLPLFTEGPLAEIAGVQVFEANRTIIRRLKADGRLFLEQSYEHSYPHCWRCRNPLIYKAVSSWFIRVTSIKKEMLAYNEQIHWIPENVKHGQFGKWLEGARDWSISRNRFWGSPIPVWVSDDPNYPRTEVYGSLAEIEEAFGRLPKNTAGEVDLHRPYIDELVRPNPEDPTGKSMMRRIPDVFDVWFDSASMPFAQSHYPFENREFFEQNQPADFIVEYIGQTRGWFYVQHVLATALFGRPAFKNVISHGIVLGSDGNKMSKSLRNYPDVNEVFERDGSDAMRWFLMSSPVIRGGNLVVTEQAIREGVRQFLLPLWNSFYFFTLYANADGYEGVRAVTASDALDRYILAKTGELVAEVEKHLEEFDTTLAALALRDFAEILTNWYVRRSRDRFWEGTSGASGSEENAEAFNTLYTVLETLTRVAAPLAPLVSEYVWKALTGGRSVHLAQWPKAEEFPKDAELVSCMDEIRQICSQVSALRKQRNLRVRLPLSQLTVVSAAGKRLEPFTQILCEELNVKEVVFRQLTETSLSEHGISFTLTVHARVAGPRLGKEVQRVIREAKAGNWEQREGTVLVDGIELKEGEYELQPHLAEEDAASDTAIAFLSEGGFVILDTVVTTELAYEGIARDAIRAIQQARKEADLNVSDRIELWLGATSEHVAALTEHEEMICEETLTRTIRITGFGGEALGEKEYQDFCAEAGEEKGATPFFTVRKEALDAQKAPFCIALRVYEENCE